MMEILTLGVLEVRERARVIEPREFGGRKPKQMLEVLAVARGRPVAKETLAGRLWGDRSPRAPMAALENHVWVLRQHLIDRLGAEAGSIVVAGPGTYRLAVESASLDLDRFDTLVQTAEDAGQAAARSSLERALALVRGELFEDEPYAEWAVPLREVYRAKVVHARLVLAEVALAEDDPSAALDHAELALESEPFSERACQLKLEAFLRRGEREVALRFFDTFRRKLKNELGVEPLPETLALHEAVRAGTPWPGKASTRLRTGINPRSAATSTGLQSPPLLGGRTIRPLAEQGSLSDGRVTMEAKRAVGHREPPLIGRTDEVRLLAEELRAAMRGRVGLVLVEGLAHVGKTRLVREALAAMPDVSSGWSQYAVPYSGLSYLPLMSALGAAIGVPVETFRRGEPPDGPLTVLSERVHRHAPVVLVLDDLHHAELGDLRAISSLLLCCADASAVIVGIARSEEVPYHHALRSLPWTTRLQVGPLSPEQFASLEGDGAFTRTGGYGAYIPSWLAGQRTGPPTDDERDAVLGRCQAAGPRAYRTLLAASALIEPLSLESVASATGAGVHDVAEDLDVLIMRGLLRDLGPSGFAFSSTLVTEALQSQLSTQRRRLIRTMPHPVALGDVEATTAV